jgi:hypothetical protein
MDLSYIKSSFPVFAIFGAVGLAWTQIKGTFSRFFSFIINTIELKDFAAGAISTFLWQNCKAIDTGTYKYHANTYLTKLYTNSVLIGSKRLGNRYQVFFYGKIPILAKYNDWEERTVTVCFMRGTINFDKLFLQAIEKWNFLVLNNKNRFRVETLVGKGPQNVMAVQLNQSSGASSTSAPPVSNSNSLTFDTLHWLTGKIFKYTIDDLGKDYQSFLKSYVLDDSLKEINDEIASWINLQSWYQEKGLIWRRGYLFYGGPGVGKTTYVRVIGTKYNLPIFRFDLSSMTNNDFIESWNRIALETPCIALFEDIDTVFNKRENISKLKNGLSFDCFLNAISGAMPAEGILLFVTTNKVETLDSALGVLDGENASRPGRIDKIIEVTNLSMPQKRELAGKILNDFSDSIEEVLIGAENLTNAQFTEKCSQLALKKVWNKV